MNDLSQIHRITSIETLEKLYEKLEAKLKLWKFLKFLFTWVVPSFFMILVFGHEYGAFFLIPMVVLGLPGLKFTEIMIEKYQGKQRQCWTRIGDLKSSVS